jgi:glutathione S-transferase
MLGGAGGVAAGVAVTFATTYALGHVAEQYYAQGQSLSAADLKALFARFRGEADTLYPRVQARIGEVARGNSLASIMQSVRGSMG